jgi:hypothetical protein
VIPDGLTAVLVAEAHGWKQPRIAKCVELAGSVPAGVMLYRITFTRTVIVGHLSTTSAGGSKLD